MFDWERFRNTNEVGIICNNEKECELFCNIASEKEIAWGDGQNYADDNGISLLKETSQFESEDVFPCIYYSDGTIGRFAYHETDEELFEIKDIINEFVVGLL